MRYLITSAALVVALLTLGNAHADNRSPADHVQARYFDNVTAVASASWPLLVAGAEMCQVKTAHRTGMNHAFVERGGKEKRVPVVAALAKGSPAELAGLRRGERILAINGSDVASMIPGRDAERLDKLIEAAAQNPGPEIVSVDRGGKKIDVSVVPVLVCNVRVEYLPGVASSAPSSGGHVILNDALFAFAPLDWQKQAFVASELAYAMSATVKRNAAVKALAGFAGGFLSAATGIDAIDTAVNVGATVSLSKQQILQTDRVALFLLARAGVDVKAVPGFWESVYAMPRKDEWANTYFGMRPTLEERREMFAKTLDEISVLRQSGARMIPPQS